MLVKNIIKFFVLMFTLTSITIASSEPSYWWESYEPIESNTVNGCSLESIAENIPPNKLITSCEVENNELACCARSECEMTLRFRAASTEQGEKLVGSYKIKNLSGASFAEVDESSCQLWGGGNVVRGHVRGW